MTQRKEIVLSQKGGKVMRLPLWMDLTEAVNPPGANLAVEIAGGE